MAPDGWIDSLQSTEAILLGAVGYPGVPDHIWLWELLITIRREFDQYVNLRPLRTIPGVGGALRNDPDIDLVIVRENSEGEYTQLGGRQWHRPRVGPSGVGVHATRHRTDRSLRMRPRDPAKRAPRAPTNSNGLVHSMPYWDEVVREVVAEYDVELEIQHVDALAARFASTPDRLDVIVVSNLFGDILSDLPPPSSARSVSLRPATSTPIARNRRCSNPYTAPLQISPVAASPTRSVRSCPLS